MTPREVDECEAWQVASALGLASSSNPTAPGFSARQQTVRSGSGVVIAGVGAVPDSSSAPPPEPDQAAIIRARLAAADPGEQAQANRRAQERLSALQSPRGGP